ncbi:unnamed protein product, partial [Vitis vinifera]|uniref:Uncharacterized protein n=1 Tax=Vitis vinifera TaxID=29760 RepID=D7T318_VITVI
MHKGRVPSFQFKCPIHSAFFLGGAYGMSQLAHIIVYIIQEKKLSYMLGLKARRINHFDKVHVLK